MAKQLLPPLDPEMAELVRQRLIAHNVGLRLEDGVAGFDAGPDGSLFVRTQNGERIPADVVILSIGVRPEVSLARDAGLVIGPRGGIRVDDQMRTSAPNVWAVGDAVETRNRVTGEWDLLALAGPANRQGRVVADVIAGRTSAFHGVQGTAVCGFFGLTAAMTGSTEKSLRRAGISDFQSVYLHPGHHVDYYPGAKPIHMKLIFRKSDGRILGVQAIGEEGVERRVDVIAMAIQRQSTVFDLEEPRAVLCAAIRSREGSRQCQRHDRGKRGSRRSGRGVMERAWIEARLCNHSGCAGSWRASGRLASKTPFTFPWASFGNASRNCHTTRKSG